MVTAVTQTQWQSIIDAARTALGNGTNLSGTVMLKLIVQAVEDATAQLAGSTNTASITAIAANTLKDG